MDPIVKTNVMESKNGVVALIVVSALLFAIHVLDSYYFVDPQLSLAGKRAVFDLFPLHDLSCLHACMCMI